MRDIETIDDRPSRAARGLQIAVGAAIVLACGVFAAGVLVGRSGKASADDASGDPLARLDQALAAEEPETATVSPSELAALGAAAEQHTTTPELASANAAAAANAAQAASTGTTAGERVEHMGQGGEQEHASAPTAGAPGAPAAPAATVPAGSDGPFTLQVASFQDEQEARRSSASLRGQGFRTFIAAADVAGRGMWFRVRIGPFRTQGEVDRARRDYEERTRQPAIVVKREDPAEGSRHGRNRH